MTKPIGVSNTDILEKMIEIQERRAKMITDFLDKWSSEYGEKQDTENSL